MTQPTFVTSGRAVRLLVVLFVGGCVSAGSHDGAGGSSGGQGGSAAGGHGAGGSTGAGGSLADAGPIGGAPNGDASTGAAGAVGNPCSARAGLLFCDDFEAWPTGSPPAGTRWTTSAAPGAVTVDSATASAPAHSGSRSVHFVPTSNSFDTFLVFHDPATLPVPGGKFFVRFFVRLASGMTGGHNTFMTADLFANPGQGNAVRVGEQQHMLMMTVAGDAHGFLSNQNFYNDGKPGVVFPAGAWACFEMSFDPGSTTLDVWVNGTEVPDMHPTNIMLDTYDALRFGFEKYAGFSDDPDAGAASLDLWYDDIAIGTQRIGCQ
jgi:hypothetical protein